MKKRILLFTLLVGFGSLTISSWRAGIGTAGYDCTGAETGLYNPTGCSTGSGGSCHSTSATAGITVAIELDSAGVATTHYRGGMTYTVKITGTNTTSNSLPAFGFQAGVIQGSAAVVTPINAGSWVTTGLPASVRYTPSSASNFVLNIVEQSAPLSPTSGTGATGTTYSRSISWTAPVAGTGTISIWGVLNAVNDNGIQDAGDLWNTDHAVIQEWPTVSAVANLSNGVSVKAYPNPTTNYLNLQLDGSQSGTYVLNVFDLGGRLIVNEEIEVNTPSKLIGINTANWAQGMYELVLEKDGDRKIIAVAKQ